MIRNLHPLYFTSLLHNSGEERKQYVIETQQCLKPPLISIVLYMTLVKQAVDSKN